MALDAATAATCSRPAGSCSTARPKALKTNEQVRKTYLGE